MWKIPAIITLAPAYIRKQHLVSFSGSAKALTALSAPVLNPNATRRWLRLLNTNKLAQKIARRDSHFLVKPLVPYLNNTYSFSNRVSVLVSHYDFTTRQFSDLAWNSIYCNDGLHLAEFVGKSGASYRVILASYSDTHNEGEMLLKIETSEGFVICFVIFSVGRHTDGDLRIELGAIQGARRTHPEISKTAAKDFHSTRPNHLLMAILYGFSKSCHIRHIACVSTRSHINRHNPSFVTDYDPFWEELGGQKISSGYYLLPPELSHRDGPARSDKHANRHRRRAQLKNEIAEMLKSRLAANF